MCELNKSTYQFNFLLFLLKLVGSDLLKSYIWLDLVLKYYQIKSYKGYGKKKNT